MTTKLSTRGQLVLPLQIRQAHDWVAGTEFTVEDTGDGILLRPKRRLKAARVEDVAGCLGYTGKVVSLEEMDEAVAEMVMERSGRGRY